MTYNSRYAWTQSPNMLGGAAFNPRNMLAPIMSESTPTDNENPTPQPTNEVVLTGSSIISPGTYQLDIHAGANPSLPSLSQIGVKIVHDPTQLSEPVFTSVEPGSYTMSTIVEPPITTTYSARVGMIRGTFIWFWKAGLENMNYLDAVGATFTDDAGVTITLTELKSDSQNTGGNPAVLYTVDQPPFMANQYPIASYFDIDIESVST